MKKEVQDKLSPSMIDKLQGKTLVMLHSYDKENDSVLSASVSWVYAKNENTIIFAVDHKSMFVKLAEKQEKMVFSFVHDEAVYSVFGTSNIKVQKSEGLTLKLAFIEVSLDEVRNVTFYGAKITQEPVFIKTYDEKLIIKLDKEVTEAINSL